MRWSHLIDGAFLLVIPALIYTGLVTADSWDKAYALSYGYTYPEPAETSNLLGVWGATMAGWLRFHTGELMYYVPPILAAVYLLAIKLPFSLFFRTFLMTALALGAYAIIDGESLLPAEQMGNLPHWLRREFPSILPLFVPLGTLALLIGCGKLILRWVDSREARAEGR